MIKVSVVVPVYNPGHYLHACVKSLLGQTLPAAEYEVVLVDDGSTDESPAYLDEVAAANPQVRVLHQENSGWPGQPRNAGLDLAQGEYVFFCDHDDWFSPDALERLHDFATACGSDVVLPKMAGLGRPVPHHVFAATVPRCGLGDAPIMDSLTPHKLFRRAFLNQHGIRFPEGRRRLEDHLFVVTAYLQADVVSIYADTTCYVHIRRADSKNAGYRKIDWPGYFDNLRESLDVVVAHTEPGPFRNRIFRRWLQVEMVNRLSGRRLLRMDPAEVVELATEAHRVASGYFSEDVVRLMPAASQRVARAVLAGDVAELRRIAEQTAPWRAYARVLQAGWVDGKLQVSGTVQLTDLSPAAVAEIERAEQPADQDEGVAGAVSAGQSVPPPEVRFGALFERLSDVEVGHGLETSSVSLDLTERETGERWQVPANVHRYGLVASFTAELDPDTLSGGSRLADGLWDLHAHIGVLGLSDRRKLPLVAERRPGAVLPGPADADGVPTSAAYFTARTSCLCLDVGLRHNRQLRPKPAPPPPPPPPTPWQRASTVTQRARRKLRRVLSAP